MNGATELNITNTKLAPTPFAFSPKRKISQSHRQSVLSIKTRHFPFQKRF